MIKLYIYERAPGIADSKLLRLFLSKNEYEGKIFQKVSVEPFKSMVEFVDDVKNAHYILLAPEYVFVRDENDYLEKLDIFAESVDKKIIVFDYGDYSDKVTLKNSIVLRSASYRSTLSSNEIIVPPFIEDLGRQYSVFFNKKNNPKPVIGFAGMVALPSFKSEVKYQLRIFLNKLKILIKDMSGAELQGLYFRRKVVKILNKCKFCVENFIIRSSFSAHEKTITIDPAVLRQEYLDVLQKSDLDLVIRGDGNYSLRFFEVLSLGRVPLFINTDSPLPLEDEINYDDFILRVDHSDIKKLPEIINNFWMDLTEERYLEMQEKARFIFETELSVDVFYKKLFTKLESECDQLCIDKIAG